MIVFDSVSQLWSQPPPSECARCHSGLLLQAPVSTVRWLSCNLTSKFCRSSMAPAFSPQSFEIGGIVVTTAKRHATASNSDTKQRKAIVGLPLGRSHRSLPQSLEQLVFSCVDIADLAYLILVSRSLSTEIANYLSSMQSLIFSRSPSDSVAHILRRHCKRLQSIRFLSGYHRFHCWVAVSACGAKQNDIEARGRLACWAFAHSRSPRSLSQPREPRLDSAQYKYGLRHTERSSCAALLESRRL